MDKNKVEALDDTDDASGHHEIIHSKDFKYLVEDEKDSGTFGKVFTCTQLNTGTPVAIKFQTTKDGQDELVMIKKIRELDPDKYNLVKFYEAFSWKQESCLVFELLDQTLKDFVNEKSHLRLDEIRTILGQLLVALQAMESISIIHSDIKLRNIMLVNHEKHPFRVKLIDFGCGFLTSEVTAGMMCQNSTSRAPEVILGLKFNETIDMWSLGLITAYMFLGFDLYDVYYEFDELRLITETQGQPPDDLLNIGVYTDHFFAKHEDTWRLKTADEYRNEVDTPFDEDVKCHFKNLHELKDHYKATNELEQQSVENFVNLLVKMLKMDPRERISPTEALQHKFMTTQHLLNTNPDTKNSLCAMDACTNGKCPQSDSRCTDLKDQNRQEKLSSSHKSTNMDKNKVEASDNTDEACGHHEIIHSKDFKYLVEDEKGSGTFGKVFSCTQLNTGTPVAIKFQTTKDAQDELVMIKKIRELDPDKYNLVKFYEAFSWKQESCLVFELLDQTLKDFVNEKSHLRLDEIRTILGQLLVALQAMESIGIIHSDIKLCNIMLVNHEKHPFRVKLIDFGCGFLTSEVTAGMMCQNSTSRAPEVILGLKFNETIDMWSLGLVTAYMFLGFDLYDVYYEFDELRLITETQGQPPDDLLNLGVYTGHYFAKHEDTWRLKTADEYRNEMGIPFGEDVKCHFKNLHELKDHYKATNELEQQSVENFVNLLVKMLKMDPRERISPTEALQHKFMTTQHLLNTNPDTKNSLCAMDACTNGKCPQSDSKCTDLKDQNRQEKLSSSHKSTNTDKNKVEASDNTDEACGHHEIIHSKDFKYLVEDEKGSGTFGKVFSCTQLNTGTPVAIKFQTTKDGQDELVMIKKIRELDPDKHNLAKFYEAFSWKQESCLVFELLDQTLEDFVNEKSHLRLDEVRTILGQLLVALQAMESISIIHSDIKPSNIMLVNHEKHPFRVKLIDFGCGFLTSEVTAGMMCQTSTFRAPEVILGLKFNETIDMWSLGLVTAYMFLGFDLYDVDYEFDELRLITETQGQPPDDLLNIGVYTGHYFAKHEDTWRLKTADEYRNEVDTPFDEDVKCHFKNLHELKDHYKATNELEQQSVENFVNLLVKMLKMDPRERISPTEALQHKFMTTQHLLNTNPDTKNSLCAMDACTNGKCPQSDSKCTDLKDQNRQEKLSSSHKSTNMDKNKVDASDNTDEACGHHEIIHSKDFKYLVEDEKGSGTFGKVFSCTQLNTGTPVAIKFQTTKDTQDELVMIKKIRELDPDKYNLVKFYEAFSWKQESCLVFELLDQTLKDFVNEKSHLRLDEIRTILGQLLVALQAMESIGIIHSDIKPSNIMLINHEKHPFRVKLIDFGCGFLTSEVTAGMMCQNSTSRAPEVILGLKFNETIDMWSLGLVTAYMFLGFDLYDVDYEFDELRLITETQGQPPDDLLNIGVYTDHFFAKHEDTWRLKTADEYRNEVDTPFDEDVKCHFKNLHELKDHYKATNELEQQSVENFVNLLVKMLKMDPRERISPTEALRHKFMTKQHLLNTNPDTKNSLCAMDACTNGKCPQSDSKCTDLKDQNRQEKLSSSHKSTNTDKNKVEVSDNTDEACGHHEIIHSKDFKYLVEDEKGSGTFGKVFSCTQLNTGTPVAIKFQTTKDAQDELVMIKKIRELDPDRYNLVQSDWNSETAGVSNNFTNGHLHNSMRCTMGMSHSHRHLMNSFIGNTITTDIQSVDRGDSDEGSAGNPPGYGVVLPYSSGGRDRLSAKPKDKNKKPSKKIQKIFSGVFRKFNNSFHKIQNCLSRLFRKVFYSSSHISMTNSTVVGNFDSNPDGVSLSDSSSVSVDIPASSTASDSSPCDNSEEREVQTMKSSFNVFSTAFRVFVKPLKKIKNFFTSTFRKIFCSNSPDL